MITTVLRGAKFRPFDAQLILLKLKAGDRLHLVPEPTNKYDPNAIQIWSSAPEEAFVGYIAKEDCEDVLGLMRAQKVRASILAENGNSPSILIEPDFDDETSGPEAA